MQDHRIIKTIVGIEDGIAACGLVIIMIGPTILSRANAMTALLPFVIGVVAAFVAYGRFRLRPILPRLAS